MAHDNDGIIKVDTTTTPYEGVEIADIQAVLGSNKNDIGQLILANDSFNNPLVNKWAKYKPVKQSGLGFPNQLNSDFTWKTTADWWKGYNGQCGMTFTTYNSLGTNNMSSSSSFFHELLAGNLSWGYERPTGGINQYPFRFLDFNYYSHNAPKPVTGVYDNLQVYGGGKLTVQLDESRAQESLGIQLSDLVISNSAVSGWYVGVLIWMSNSQFTFAFSQNTLGGNGGLDVEFTNMTSYGGHTATIVPFLSSVRSNQGVDPGAGIFLSCDVAPQTVNIRAEVTSVTMTIDAQWRWVLPGPVHYDIRIINNSGATVSVSNMVIALYDGDPSDGGVRVEYKPTIATFNISNGDFHDEIGNFVNQYYDSTKTYYVVVSSSRTEVNGKKEVEASRN